MSQIPRFSPSISWLVDMLDMAGGNITKVPSDYRSQVLCVKKMMNNDVTGLIASLLDFGISSASDVNFEVETDNPALTQILNNWLSDINGELLGQIPLGIEALSKEYYRERWKGSSLLLLRTIWGSVDGFKLPLKMWFVDGEDILVKSDTEKLILGDEKYSILIDRDNPKKNIQLPSGRDELIFVQKPFSAWGTPYPTPFLISRGLYRNARFIEQLTDKGEIVIAKALEYMMVVKKGTEALAREGRSEFIYSDEDLTKVKEHFGLLINNRVGEQGVPSYITNFDTDIEHLIPEYERILKPALYAPAEKRILAGLGLIDIVASTSTSKREGTLNPKAYVGELNSGVNDLASLLQDILKSIVIANKENHPKYFSSRNSIRVTSTPVKAFMTDDYKTMLRSIYDRGGLSRKAFVEVVGDFKYSQQRDRRMIEAEQGDDIIMRPPVIQNQEQYADVEQQQTKETKDIVKEENTLPDRTGPEADNFNQSVAEEAVYENISELPDQVKNVMSKSLQKVWLDIFNKSSSKGNEIADKVAWDVINKIAVQDKNDKWVRRKSKGSLEEASIRNISSLDDIYTMKKIDLLDKKQELVNKLIGGSTDEITE